jgi:uncharacterized protein
MERKTIKFEVKAVDEAEGIIEGYGSTFGGEPDSYGDVVDEGTFTKTIKENSDSIVSLFNHDTYLPIGKPELSQDKIGLFTRIKLVRGVQKAEETLLLAKAGVIRKMSIGYDTIKSEMINGIRHLKEVRLYDVSPVVFAANNNAVILDVKAAERSLDNNDIQPIKDAVKAIQALLEKKEGKEPDKATLNSQETQEAAQLDAAVSELNGTLSGLDAVKVEARIGELMEILKN